MKTVHSWVLGSGGLLGSHLSRELSQASGHFVITPWQGEKRRLAWNQPQTLDLQLAESMNEFLRAAYKEKSYWMLFWAAGSGVVNSTEESLTRETEIWAKVLFYLDKALIQLGEDLPGFIFFASSAGAVYGDCKNGVITENSSCSPISFYGRNKLRQEKILEDWCARHPKISYLIGRISNLYGPGQNLLKPQGLISHISKSLLSKRPVHIYMPLDTIRDYVYVRDCACHIVRCALKIYQQALQDSAPRVIKIFASEESRSLYQIVGTFSRIAKRFPRITGSVTNKKQPHPKKVRFRSVVLRNETHFNRVSLPVGIAKVFQDHIALSQNGKLG